MNKFMKVFSTTAVVAMIASSFAGCGGGKETSDGKSFTYWAVKDGAVPTAIEGYGDMLYYQKLEEATGVKITFSHPAQGSEGSEAFTTTLASGKDSLPDMMEYGWDQYPGGPDKAISDGAIVSLNDYINEKITPNYYDFMEGEKAKEYNGEYKKQSKSDEGNYFGFNNLNIGKYRGFCGLFV